MKVYCGYDKCLHVRAKLRELGWRRFGVVACRLIWERIYRREHHVLFQRSSCPVRLPMQIALRAVPITRENIETYTRTFPERRAGFLRRLSLGLQGFFYLKEDGTLLAYHWYALGADYYEPKYCWTIRLREREAYILDFFVLPEHRGSIATTVALTSTLNAARARGAETIFSFTAKNNRASWKLHLYLGFEIIGCLEVTRVFTRAVRAHQVDVGQYADPEMLAAMNRRAPKKSYSPSSANVPRNETVAHPAGWRLHV